MPLDYEKLMSARLPPAAQQYTRKDTILYALGVGVGALAPEDPGELKYLYEQQLMALPTQAVVLAADALRLADPAMGVNYRMVVHAEQAMRVHKTLPPEGQVHSETTINEIYDKGAAKGAILHSTRRLYDSRSGDLLSTMDNLAFLRGDGGFGGKSEGLPQPRAVPTDRPPDLQLPLSSSPNQAAIYRLSGDYNPLHIDPAVARSAGFDRPILHGLCAYGMVGRALIRALCGDEPSKLRRLDVRFTSPAYAGEPLHIELWKLAAGDAAFRVVATRRHVVVEDFGRLEYE